MKNLKVFFGNPTLDHVTPKRIVAYKNHRYAGGVKPATINRELATLKKAFNLARREWEWCQDNPVSRVSMEQEHNTRDRWLTEDEEARLLGVAPGWLGDLLLFALHIGMRQGKILSLMWAGVDLFRRTVTVFKSKNGERRLGHKSPVMTQRYAHHYPEGLRDGVDVLDLARSVSTKPAQSEKAPGCAAASY